MLYYWDGPRDPMSPFGPGGPWDPGSSWAPMFMSLWGAICQKRERFTFYCNFYMQYNLI